MNQLPAGDPVEPAVEPAEGAAVWDPLAPDQVVPLLAKAGVQWWVTGGQALDVFLGHSTRAHADLDVAVLRRDQQAFRRALPGWDLVIRTDGGFAPWAADTEVPGDAYRIWARETPSGPWRIEIVLEECEGERWQFRGKRQIGVSVADLGRRDERGVPYVRPEVVLLYKSKTASGTDETDLLTVLPKLDKAARGWLFAALWTSQPGHRWLERLK